LGFVFWFLFVFVGVFLFTAQLIFLVKIVDGLARFVGKAFFTGFINKLLK